LPETLINDLATKCGATKFFVGAVSINFEKRCNHYRLILACMLSGVSQDRPVIVGWSTTGRSWGNFGTLKASMGPQMGGTGQPSRAPYLFSGRRREEIDLTKVRSTQANSGLYCAELAQLRPLIVGRSTLCRAVWARNDSVRTTMQCPLGACSALNSFFVEGRRDEFHREKCNHCPHARGSRKKLHAPGAMN
jgi:hypothetical protein